MDWQEAREIEARLLLRMKAAQMGEDHWRTLVWTLTAVSASVSTELFGWRWATGMAVAIGLTRWAREHHDMYATVRWLARAGFSQEWLDAETAAAGKDLRDAPCARRPE